MTYRARNPNEYGSNCPRRTTCSSFQLCPFLRVKAKRSLRRASSSPTPNPKQQRSFIVHKVWRASLTSTTSSSPIRLIFEELTTKSPASAPPGRTTTGLATGNVVSHVEQQQLLGEKSPKGQDNTVTPTVIPGSCTAGHYSAPCCEVHAHWQPVERGGEWGSEWGYKSVYRLARPGTMTDSEGGKPSSVVETSPNSKNVTNTTAAMSPPSAKKRQEEKIRMHMARLGPLAPEGYKDMAKCVDVDGRCGVDGGCQLDGAANSQLDWGVNKDGDKEGDSGEAGNFPGPGLLLTTNNSKTSSSNPPCSRSLPGQEVPLDPRGGSGKPSTKQSQNDAQADDRRTLPSQRRPLSSKGHIVEPPQGKRGYRQVFCQIVAHRHGGDEGEGEEKPCRLYPELRRKPGCRSLRESTSRVG